MRNKRDSNTNMFNSSKSVLFSNKVGRARLNMYSLYTHIRIWMSLYVFIAFDVISHTAGDFYCSVLRGRRKFTVSCDRT